MIALAPASVPGLVVHALRLSWRGRVRPGRVQRLIAALVLGGYALGCGWLGWSLRDTPIVASPELMTAAAITAFVLFSFGFSQALGHAETALYGSGDLDLLLGAPIAPRTVLWAKLLGIAATVLRSHALFLLPPLLPLVVLGHPALACAVVLLPALALVETCAGLVLMLLIVRLAGPRAARSTAQVLTALLAGSVVICTQILRAGGHGQSARNGYAVVYGWARAHHWGETGAPALIARAALGDGLATAALVVLAVALFALTGIGFERGFLAAYRRGVHTGASPARRRRTAKTGISARFARSLLGAILTKELALLRRSPQIMATMLLRMIYLVPMMLILLREQGALLPSVAFIGVFVATQLTGDLAWLVISGEDSPDLMAAAPVAPRAIGRARMLAAMTLGMIALTPVVALLLVRAPILLVVVLPGGLIGAAAAARIQLALEKPTPRSRFGRRAHGASIAANLLVLVSALVIGGVTSAVAWLLLRA